MAAKSGWMASNCCWEVPGGRQIISWLWAALAHAQHTAGCVEVQSGVLVVKLCGQQQPGLPALGQAARQRLSACGPALPCGQRARPAGSCLACRHSSLQQCLQPPWAAGLKLAR
ncbi:hypothetical protein HaLaN_15425, partial [Haematococcus lacustris]